MKTQALHVNKDLHREAVIKLIYILYDCMNIVIKVLTAVAKYFESFEKVTCVIASRAYRNGVEHTSRRLRLSNIRTVPLVKPTAEK